MCGVSTQTVSRVINKRPDVSQRTREAVEAAIASVGFQPSEVARSLVQRRSQMIGVVATGLRYFGVAQTLNGIAEESEASGYVLLLKELPGSGKVDILPVIEFLIAHRVEGIIFAAPELGGNIDSAVGQLPATTPPIVFLKTESAAGISTIVIDNYGGARQATSHLLSLGRRRIAHIAGPVGWHEAEHRQEGWRDAIVAAGLVPGPVVSGNWSSASGAAAFERLLELDPGLDAVFAGNDQMALGLLHVAHRRGIAIPDDVPVVGFDGLDESAEFTPSLTTVAQPLRELGRLAVQELLAAVNDETGHPAARALTLAAELVVRESAPAPATPPAVASGPAPIRGGTEAITTNEPSQPTATFKAAEPN